jgi:hypothetical protein
MTMAYFALRLIISIQIKIYNIEGYEVYLLPTILYYLVIFMVVTGVFWCFKFFYTIYDDEKITYYNRIMRREVTVKFTDIKYVIFGKNGVKLYRELNPSSNESADLFIPFFRFGIIDAISINELFEKLINTEHIKVEKAFKVLPGYTKKWRIVSMMYSLLAFSVLILCITPLRTVMVLFAAYK